MLPGKQWKKKNTLLIFGKRNQTIVGFIVVQSLLLSAQLVNQSFVEKVEAVSAFKFILTSHVLITSFAIFALLYIDYKLSKKLKNNVQLRKDIYFMLFLP
jgi:hypothetical protein